MTPVRQVTDLELRKLDGTAQRFSALPRRWALLYIGSSDCQSVCEQALYTMRQTIVAQGREAHRVHPLMIATDTKALDSLRRQLAGYPDVTAFTGSSAEIARLSRELEMPGTAADSHYIYIVDPLGNVAMRFSLQADPSGLRKDLQRLLRYSHIG
jgi:cytochrome oxidase Cu insertion factor (SCO1/SenC/PrrC family)